MKRREFIRAAGGTALASTLATPAIAKGTPTLTWRLACAYPNSLDTLYGAATTFCNMVEEATDGNFKIQLFGPSELVSPGNGVEAVGNGTVEMAATGSNIFVGLDPTFALASHVPFGVNTRMQNAFFYDGDGIRIWNEFFAKYNIYALPMSCTGAQMGGWFRNELAGADALDGLKMRIGGLGGRILGKLGLVAQNIPGGEVYSALERGTLDAAEWVGPYDDEKLGFVQVAPYYYYPGFWEGASQGQFYFNLDRWNDLPAHYKTILRAAAAYVQTEVLAKYDHRSAASLKRLVAAGAQLRIFPTELLDAAHQATQEVFTEISAENAEFKKMLDLLMTEATDDYLWWRVAEYSYDSYMIRSMR